MSWNSIRFSRAAVWIAILGTSLSIAGLYVLPRLRAEGIADPSFRGNGVVTHIPPGMRNTGFFGPTPGWTETDNDGDGIPNDWETEHGHGPNDEDDAHLDFDMDGLTTAQEYELFQRTNGEHGDPIGKYAKTTISRPSGYTSASYTIQAVASNGVAAILVNGSPLGQRLYTYHPATAVWKQVQPVAGHEGWTLKANDVNSQGVVVGTITSSNVTKGFIWSPSSSNPSVWESRLFVIEPGSSSSVAAIPRRVSDTGYFVYSTTTNGAGLAADPKQRRIDPIYNPWTTPNYVDVNDFGEYIGFFYDPATWTLRVVLAIPYGPVYISEMSVANMYWSVDYPSGYTEIDPSTIQWEILSEYDENGEWIDRWGQYEYGTAPGTSTVFRRQWGYSEVWSSDDQVTWQFVWAFDDSAPSLLNDWGEFVGYYSAGTVWQEGEDGDYEYWESYGSYFYDGWYHAVDSQYRAVLDMSNDPQVLLWQASGSSAVYALWSDNIVCPISKMLPAGYPAPAEARLFDGCRFYIKKNSTTLEILARSDDADGDGMPDDWEVYYGFNPALNDANWDLDNDGKSNYAEFLLRSNPTYSPVYDSEGNEIDTRPGIDTDSDGMPNSWEVGNGTNYNDSTDAALDFDRDGYTNLQEYLLNTDPRGAPSYRVREIGPFSSTSSVTLSSAFLTEGVVSGVGNVTESVIFNAVPASGTPAQRATRPGAWSLNSVSTSGSFAPYLPHGTSTATTFLACAENGAVLSYSGSWPSKTFYYWRGPDPAAVTTFSGSSINTADLVTPSISPSGLLVAGMRQNTSQSWQPVLWNVAAGGSPSVRSLAGTNASVYSNTKLFVNDAGYSAATAKVGGSTDFAILWKPDGSNVTLSPLAGGSVPSVVGITNTVPPVVAGNCRDSSGKYRAVCWAVDGTVRDLGLASTSPPLKLVALTGHFAALADVLDGGELKQQPTILTPNLNGSSPSWSSRAQGPPVGTGLASLKSLSNVGELLGTLKPTSIDAPVPTLWRYGRSHPLDHATPYSEGYAITSIEKVNATGALLATAWKDGAPCKLLLTPDHDTDGDGMPDIFENQYAFNALSSHAPALDSDTDGLSDLDEYRNGTNPRDPDSDGDGMKDGWEVSWGLLPLDSSDATLDPDGDHVTNLRESQIDTNPTGTYLVDILTAPPSEHYHAAADDGSVITASGTQETDPYGYWWREEYKLWSAPEIGIPRESIDLPEEYHSWYDDSGNPETIDISVRHYNAGNGKVRSFIENIYYGWDSNGDFEYTGSLHLAENSADDQVPWIDFYSAVYMSSVTNNLPNITLINDWPRAVSPTGNRRAHYLYLSSEDPGSFVVLDEKGEYVSTLADKYWISINNLGQAISIEDRTVSGGGGTPDHTVHDLLISDGILPDKTVALPAEWFPAPATPTLNSFSDDGIAIVGRAVRNPDGTIRFQSYAVNVGTGEAAKVRMPGIGSETVVSLSRQNKRLLGSGPKPFQITPDGTCIRLEALRTKNSPTAEPVPFGSLYPKPLAPKHIASDGRITLSTTDTQNQHIILQIVPNNDADGNGLADDLETSILAYMLESGIPSGNLDPAGDFDEDGLTNSVEHARNLNPSRKDNPKVRLQIGAE